MFSQVQWDTFEDDEAHEDLGNENRGVLLTVGFLPGLTVDLIPLSKTQVILYSSTIQTFFYKHLCLIGRNVNFHFLV